MPLPLKTVLFKFLEFVRIALTFFSIKAPQLESVLQAYWLLLYNLQCKLYKDIFGQYVNGLSDTFYETYFTMKTLMDL